MFVLENSLNDWRTKLHNNSSFTNSDIDELENHLLEEITLLKEKNLSEEESFFIACNRLGSIDLLTSEFTKVNFNAIWLKNILWLLGGYIIITFSQQAINMLSILATATLNKLATMDSHSIIYLNLVINIILSILILSLLFLPRYMLISKLQASFNYLFSSKLWALILLFFIFIFINSVGIKILQGLLVYKLIPSMSVYGDIMLGENLFTIVWSILLCIFFMLLSYKKSK
jgi:hypothetical protein